MGKHVRPPHPSEVCACYLFCLECSSRGERQARSPSPSYRWGCGHPERFHALEVNGRTASALVSKPGSVWNPSLCLGAQWLVHTLACAQLEPTKERLRILAQTVGERSSLFPIYFSEEPRCAVSYVDILWREPAWERNQPRQSRIERWRGMGSNDIEPLRYTMPEVYCIAGLFLV